MDHLPLLLVQYGIQRLGLSSLDAISSYNQLLTLLKLHQQLDINLLNHPSIPLPKIKEMLELHFKTLDDHEKESIIHHIFHLISPSPSIVNSSFWSLIQHDQLQAFDYLLTLQIGNNYIKKSAVDNNLHWNTKVDGYPLEITINTSKPEKKNTDTAKLLTSATQLSYPQCVLCKQNLGFSGHLKHPSRQNLRIIELTLDDKPWFFQYSPYAYFPYHSIVIDQDHINMSLSKENLSKLYAFVDLFPNLFIGSNSDLPIVGGSILNHAHFQAGLYTLPMMKALTKKTYSFSKFNATIHQLDWFNTALRIDSVHREDGLAMLLHLFTSWQQYSNPLLSIINSKEAMHNTMTVIVKKHDLHYQTFVILRNNATNDTYPEGIFHAHPIHHSIKQESIGLIEAMGLFILPGRLKKQLQDIATLVDPDLSIPHSLQIHHRLIHHIRLLQPVDIEGSIRSFIDKTCAEILINTAVFKNNQEGNDALESFITGLDFNF